MSNPNKAKGSRWELALRRLFQQRGLRVSKPWQEGHADAGDIHLEDWAVCQAKDWGSISGALREGTSGARVQTEVAGRQFGFAAIKLRGAATGKGYAAVTIDDMIEHLLYVEGLRDRIRTLEAQQAH